MSSFSTLGVLAAVVLGAATFSGTGVAELGGEVVARPHELPAVVPVTVRLLDGDRVVAATHADMLGRYSLTAPPGEYRLAVTLREVEAHVERVQLLPGSWEKHVEVTPSWSNRTAQPVAVVVERAVSGAAQAAAAAAGPARAELAEVCGVVRGRNGAGVPAAVLAYDDDECVTGARADITGRYCLSASPGTHWLRVMVASTDVAYERVVVPPASLERNLESAVEVIELPPLQVTASPPTPTSSRS